MYKRWLAGLGLFSVIIGVGVVGTAAPSMGAVVRTCTATFTPDPLPVGQSVHENVTGFDPNEVFTETVVINSGSPSANDHTANASGVYNFDSGAAPAEVAGFVYQFTFLGKTSGATCSGSFTVGDAPTTTSTAIASTTTVLATTSTAPAAKAAAVTATPAFTG